MPSEEVLKQIELALAEGFWVPCPGCTSGNCPNAAWYLRTGDVMVGCQGSGRRYPFRLPCPGTNIYGGEDPETCWNGLLKGNPFDPSYNARRCDTCSGLGYVFNPDPDVLWDAIRAKGWHITLETDEDGDMVLIFARLGGESYDFRSEVMTEEGLRGQAALQTAVHRAMEAHDDQD